MGQNLRISNPKTHKIQRGTTLLTDSEFSKLKTISNDLNFMKLMVQFICLVAHSLLEIVRPQMKLSRNMNIRYYQIGHNRERLHKPSSLYERYTHMKAFHFFFASK